MYLLDTDHLSMVDQDTIESFNLGRRLSAVPPGEVAVTIITYEEQMRGWLAYIARAKTTSHKVQAYRRLRSHVERYRYERDSAKPNAWRYRDYVIQSLNRDKLYEQFVTEQLSKAGMRDEG